MSRWVMFTQALQDLLVVDEAMQRPQDEDIQRDVADLLQLKLPAQALQAWAGPARLLQLQQSLRLFVQAPCQRLQIGKVKQQGYIAHHLSAEQFLTLKAWIFFSMTSPMRWESPLM